MSHEVLQSDDLPPTPTDWPAHLWAYMWRECHDLRTLHHMTGGTYDWTRLPDISEADEAEEADEDEDEAEKAEEQGSPTAQSPSPSPRPAPAPAHSSAPSVAVTDDATSLPLPKLPPPVPLIAEKTRLKRDRKADEKAEEQTNMERLVASKERQRLERCCRYERRQ